LREKQKRLAYSRSPAASRVIERSPASPCAGLRSGAGRDRKTAPPLVGGLLPGDGLHHAIAVKPCNCRIDLGKDANAEIDCRHRQKLSDSVGTCRGCQPARSAIPTGTEELGVPEA